PSTRYSLFAIRHSLLAIRYSPFAIRYSLLAIRYSILAIRHSLLAIRYSLFATRHSLSDTRYSPFATRHSLLAIRYSLFATRHRRRLHQPPQSNVRRQRWRPSQTHQGRGIGDERPRKPLVRVVSSGSAKRMLEQRRGEPKHIRPTP